MRAIILSIVILSALETSHASLWTKFVNIFCLKIRGKLELRQNENNAFRSFHKLKKNKNLAINISVQNGLLEITTTHKMTGESIKDCYDISISDLQAILFIYCANKNAIAMFKEALVRAQSELLSPNSPKLKMFSSVQQLKEFEKKLSEAISYCEEEIGELDSNEKSKNKTIERYPIIDYGTMMDSQ